MIPLTSMTLIKWSSRTLFRKYHKINKMDLKILFIYGYCVLCLST